MIFSVSMGAAATVWASNHFVTRSKEPLKQCGAQVTGRLTCDTKKSDWAILALGIIILVSTFLFVRHDSTQLLKKNVTGSWAEVRGTNEIMQFNIDGTVIMQSPSEYHRCLYDFPGAHSIRLDCAIEGELPNPRVWDFSLTTDKMTVSDGREVGTYERE